MGTEVQRGTPVCLEDRSPRLQAKGFELKSNSKATAPSSTQRWRQEGGVQWCGSIEEEPRGGERLEQGWRGERGGLTWHSPAHSSFALGCLCTSWVQQSSES